MLTAPGQPFALGPAVMFGRHVNIFTNAPPTLHAIYEGARSDKPFLIFEDERLSFDETFRRAATLAHALVRDFGIARGDRVAIAMRNYPEWIIAFLAITSIGGIAVALNSLWQGEELDYGLTMSGTRVLIADDERVARLGALRGAHADLRLITVRTATPPPGALALETLFAGPLAAAMPDQSPEPDDDAIMAFTSGSTGHPKGAVTTHRSSCNGLMGWALEAEIAIATGEAERAPENGPQPVALLSTPMFHVLGFGATLLRCFGPQMALVLMRRWDAEEGVRIVQREGVNVFVGPPTTSGDLVEAARRMGVRLDTLVQVGGGGAARPPEQVRAIGELFPTARPGTGWGMTETCGVGTIINGATYAARPLSAGPAVAGAVELRVVGEDGRVLPPGERGELQIRGAVVMRGYWENPDANAKAFDGEWFRTGDVAIIEPDGFMSIVDRIKDLVIRGGENIGCGRVEAALAEHPDVVEACVYGVPDPRMGEELACTLQVRRVIPEGELRDFLAPHLAAFEIPRYYEQLPEPLPRVGSGKINKRHLRDLAAQRLARAAA